MVSQLSYPARGDKASARNQIRFAQGSGLSHVSDPGQCVSVLYFSRSTEQRGGADDQVSVAGPCHPVTDSELILRVKDGTRPAQDNFPEVK